MNIERKFLLFEKFLKYSSKFMHIPIQLNSTKIMKFNIFSSHLTI